MISKKVMGLAILMASILTATIAITTVNACPLTPGFTPGFWKHNIGVALGYNNGAYSAFEGGPQDGVKLTKAMLDSYAAAIGVTLEEAYEALSTGGGGAIAQARADMANAFNAEAGYGPFGD